MFRHAASSGTFPCLKGHFFACVCASNSALNFVTIDRAGIAAASASTQIVRPTMPQATSSILGISSARPLPCSIFAASFSIQPGAFAARRALAARLVVVEPQRVPERVDDAGVVVDHDDAARAEHRLGGGQGVEVDLERRIGEHLGRREHRRRRPAGDHRLELLPARGCRPRGRR